MIKITLEQFNAYITEAGVKPRLKNSLRFIQSTEAMTDEQWANRELLPITDRTGTNGVLLIGLENELHILPYELHSGITSSSTGRSQSIICDFCKTWQYGNKSGSIRFRKDRVTTVAYLCCEDLKCSLHVRNLTTEAFTSRAQLREDISIEQRIERLRVNLQTLVESLTPAHIQI